MAITFRVFLIAISLVLIGCINTRYGVDQETWDSLTEAQKTATITSYNQRKELEAQRRLFEAERRLLESKAEYAITQKETNLALDNAPRIEVTFRNGRIIQDGELYEIQRKKITIAHGIESQLNLRHHTDKDKTIKIPVSYQKGRFVFGEDEGKSQLRTSLQYKYEDAWRRGKSYRNQRIPLHADYSGSITIEIQSLVPSYQKSTNNDDNDLVKLLIKELVD